MAYTDPPTYADGEPLSATHLNIHSDNDEHFYGLISGPRAMFTGTIVKDKSLASDNHGWRMRRYGRYLHFRFYQFSGTRSGNYGLKLYDASETLADTETRSSIGTTATNTADTGYIDLDNLDTGTIAEGDLFLVQAFATKNDASFNLEITYLFNSDATSITV